MATSFLKWAGGKTRSAPVLAQLRPPAWDRWVEPFCGSAAVFFQLAPCRALLADANPDLIVALQRVAECPGTVMDILDSMPNSRTRFEFERAKTPERMKPNNRAARTVYLNKTAFRGLWRVNRQGRFNTPYGAYDRPLYNRATLLEASILLRSAEVRCADFRDVLVNAGEGDWVYLDPPYVPDRAWGDFTRYTAGQFGAEDHECLAALAKRAVDNGAHVMVTNSDMPEVRQLYAEFHVAVLPTRRDIALKKSDRPSADLIATSYPVSHRALVPVHLWDAA